MSEQKSTIIYTETDEAPALATYSLLPIIKAFCKASDVEVDIRDISLSGRIIANFPDYLSADQQISDALAELGELTQDPMANIIKLPNISASIPQMKAAIKELQDKGYALPDYPEEPANEKEQDAKARYDKIKGSAVNPVLREGNSDRRAPGSVKNYAKKNPHSMGAWSADSKSHVASMTAGDFFGSEKSTTLPAATSVNIQHTDAAGNVTVLKEGIALQAGEVIDASCMSVNALRKFLAEQIDDAKEQGVLMSLHMKATMMKVSDPIIFGHCVTVFYAAVFEKYGELFKELGVDPNNGVGDVYAKIKSLPADKQAEIEADIAADGISNKINRISRLDRQRRNFGIRRAVLRVPLSSETGTTGDHEPTHSVPLRTPVLQLTCHRQCSCCRSRPARAPRSAPRCRDRPRRRWAPRWRCPRRRSSRPPR